MKKIKLPTSQELGMDVKKMLRENIPTKFKDWQQIAEKEFKEKLSNWLNKRGLYTSELFKEIYQIIFYYGFINFHHERDFKKYLEWKKGFEIVYYASDVLDRYHSIDVYGKRKNGKWYCFQIKNNESNFTEKEKDKIKAYAVKRHMIPALAFKNGKKWHFKKV